MLSDINRIVRGGNGLCDGPVSEENLPLVVQRVQDGGFGNIQQVRISMVYLQYVLINRLFS